MARAVVRASWSNLPKLRATIERVVAGRVVTRKVGPRGYLELDEAAALAGVSVADLQRAIRLGDLRVTRAGARRRVTVQALGRMLREDAADGAIAQFRAGEPTKAAAEVHQALRA